MMLFLATSEVFADQKMGDEHYFFGETTVISKRNEGMLRDVIARYNKHGGTIVINADAKKGPMPVPPNHNTRIVDLRYNGGVDIVRGNHPRLEGVWPQYSGLNTGLGKNFVVSDVLPYDAQVESWKGKMRDANPANKSRTQDAHEYSNTHNHYQNFLSEVWDFSPNVNAVALWGDSGAFYPGAKSWGGFLSARSWPVHWQQYVPEGTPAYANQDFDAQLVGLEVDVLNGGLPQGKVSKLVGMPLSKSGIQVVGFGQRNTAAIEIRTEDSDDMSKKADERKGTWHYGIIAYNSLNSDSTFLFSATPSGRTGADFSMTDYSDSAIKLKSNGSHSGISFNEYTGGELYSQDGNLIVRAGNRGLAVLTPNGRELLRVGRFGLVSWNGINMLVFVIPLLFILIWLVVRNVSLSREVKDIRMQLASAT